MLCLAEISSVLRLHRHGYLNISSVYLRFRATFMDEACEKDINVHTKPDSLISLGDVATTPFLKRQRRW